MGRVPSLGGRPSTRERSINKIRMREARPLDKERMRPKREDETEGRGDGGAKK